jgi:hypothetical protein
MAQLQKQKHHILSTLHAQWRTTVALETIKGYEASHLAGTVFTRVSYSRPADPISIVAVRHPVVRHSNARLLSTAGGASCCYANMQRTCAVKRRLQPAVPQALDTKGKTCGLVSRSPCEALSNMPTQVVRSFL